MLRKIVIGILAVMLMLITVACANSAAPTAGTQPSASTSSSAPQTIQATTEKPSGPIKAQWIEPQVNGETVYIPLSEVQNDWNTHFRLDTQAGKMTFMAYLLNNKIYVRANVCPPCRSIGYALDNNILVCERCATTFKADTGDGIQGACVDYPKALVPCQITNGNIAMKQADLVVAYENTLNPGWP